MNEHLVRIKKLAIAVLSIILMTYGCASLVMSQVMFQTFYRRGSPELQSKLNMTKKAFISLLICILNFVSPSSIRISTDNATLAKGTFRKSNGKIISQMKRRSIIIANHQIYTDWVFLWWLTSTADLAGSIYIMLKKSLESIPLLGYGMRNFKFIFLSRKWAQDKIILHNSLGVIDANSRGVGPLSGARPIRVDDDGEMYWDVNKTDDSKAWPYCLLLFPEGTNLSATTRRKSASFAEKVGRQPFSHVLLPHSTGLRSSLILLRASVEVVYDITIGYSGVGRSDYGEMMYRLPNIFLRGQTPKLVDMHIRAFNLAEIPVDDEEAFSQWLYEVWKEKDDLMEKYYTDGTFASDPELNQIVVGGFNISPKPVLVTCLLPAVLVFSLLLVGYLAYAWLT
ncbi:hypothetical protein HG536_0C03130 [Torulaspora globosa]|uniref:Phospholipid/glycerol acyltransferase domain-containing protein n=1 Tax=Torulaspora globosa TaxID=48254 RepID=A0A7G3ZF59_9SACH|nr:uncharacterized protein HG536_0C03130 [Torulaspora globosa]QLL32145.1 hypothetical protein HG536_0C03130 [Torulaspora globosa]